MEVRISPMLNGRLPAVDAVEREAEGSHLSTTLKRSPASTSKRLTGREGEPSPLDMNGAGSEPNGGGKII